MSWLMPEPASDIRAQIEAMLDPRHPKRAVFAVPGNDVDILKVLGMAVVRIEGTLVSADAALRERFIQGMPDEAGMAAILGYPEPKDAAIAACRPEQLRAVQAVDWRGNVITEAVCSPGWLDRTGAALRHHGDVRVLTAMEVFHRRFSLRLAETIRASA